jgi:DNA mismatch repair ATPase MutS
VIGRGDDLASGTSYYKDEVDAVLAVVRLCEDQRPQLFLFDELFRGTSTTERIAAAEAVLRELLERPEQADCAPPGAGVVIAATHDRDLVRLLDGQYAPYHFTDTVGSDGLSFDYRLREGPAVSRNAVALLEAYGAPARVVRRARARQADLDGAGTQ